jgi:hypothetical protein
MAKVTGPLMSQSASGSYGGVLVFGTNMGRHVVRSKVTPANPRTAGQQRVRLSFAAAVAAYHQQTSTIKTNFKALASSMQTKPFQAFVSNAQKQFKHGLGPQISPNAAPDGTAVGLSLTTATGGVGEATLTWTDPTDPTNWLLWIYRKNGADPTGAVSELIACVPRGVQKFVDSPLAAGTWHYNVASSDQSGSFSGIGTVQIATVS